MFAITSGEYKHTNIIRMLGLWKCLYLFMKPDPITPTNRFKSSASTEEQTIMYKRMDLFIEHKYALEI